MRDEELARVLPITNRTAVVVVEPVEYTLANDRDTRYRYNRECMICG